MAEDDIFEGNRDIDVQTSRRNADALGGIVGRDDAETIRNLNGRPGSSVFVDVDNQRVRDALSSGDISANNGRFEALVTTYDKEGNIIATDVPAVFNENVNELVNSAANEGNQIFINGEGQEVTVITPQNQDIIYSVTEITSGNPNGISSRDFAGVGDDGDLGPANINDHKVEWNAPNGETITLYQPPTATSATIGGTDVDLTGQEYGPTRQLYYHLEPVGPGHEGSSVVVSDQEYRLRVSLEPEPEMIPVPEDKFIELVDQFQTRETTHIEIPFETVRNWQVSETVIDTEQAAISSGFAQVDWGVQNEAGEYDVATDGVSATLNSVDGASFRQSFALNDPIQREVITEEVAPLIEPLNFSNGIIDIPANSTGEITFQPKQGDALFNNNPGVLIALDANGNPLRAMTTATDGSITLDSAFLEGAAGVTTAIVPDGGNNGLENNKIYNVGQATFNEGLALFDGNTEIRGSEHSGASLISPHSALNPGGQKLTVIDGNVVHFEDVANTPNQRDAVWPSDMDLRDYSVTMDGQTRTPQFESRVEITTNPVIYGGWQTNTNMRDSVSTGVHIGIEQNPLKVNEETGELEPNNGWRWFADAEINAGIAPETVTETTTISEYEARQNGVETQSVTTMQEGETRTIVNETTGEVVNITRTEGDVLEIARTSSVEMGPERITMTGQSVDVNQYDRTGLGANVVGRVGGRFGNPNLEEGGRVTGGAYLEGRADTNGETSLSAVGEANYVLGRDGDSNTRIGGRVSHGLAGHGAGETLVGVQITHGGSQAPEAIDTRAAVDNAVDNYKLSRAMTSAAGEDNILTLEELQNSPDVQNVIEAMSASGIRVTQEGQLVAVDTQENALAISNKIQLDESLLAPEELLTAPTSPAAQEQSSRSAGAAPSM